jgi:uncharacterized protein with von Willebrand factor type A (vWA) domain
MNLKMCLRVSALVSAVIVIGLAQTVADYQPLMKAGASANGALRKTLESDLAGAADQAAQVKAAFAKIEQFWAKHKVEDAQKWARSVMEGADAVAAAAKAGNKEAAMAAAKGIGANCQGCHTAHRDKGADGQFIIK